MTTYPSPESSSQSHPPSHEGSTPSKGAPTEHKLAGHALYREGSELIGPTETIYEDDILIIRPEVASAVPGLYTIEPQSPKAALHELSATEVTLLAYMQQRLRRNLRSLFNVALCGLYVEEHPGKLITSHSIPLHLDRLAEKFSIETYQPHIADYLKSYGPSSSGHTMSIFNTGMQRALNSPDARQDIADIKKGKIDTPEAPTVHKNVSEVKVKVDEVLEFYDESELPEPPNGKKYFVCIGGSKNFQGFLSDSNLSKGEFLLAAEGEIDSCLDPVYDDGRIIVRQDAKYAIPGFYIVGPKEHYRSIDEMPLSTYRQCMLMARAIKQGLALFGVDQTHLYHDEKYKSPASAHFWVLPVHTKFMHEQNLRPTIYSRDIWTYLDSFPRYSATKSQILEFNAQMRVFLSQYVPQEH